MALAYTPGLKVKAATNVRKVRRLPIAGDVLVKLGETVSFDTVVAKTEIPGEARIINAAGTLQIDPQMDDLMNYMTKKVGEDVEENEVIAKRVEFFGLSKSFCRSPVKGKVELVSDLTGQVCIREGSVSVNVTAYIPGKVVEILPHEGLVVETVAALIQGIFGIGGETYGKLMILTDSPNEILTADKITSACAGKILVGGALVTIEALRKAVEVGVKGIIVGGIEEETLIKFMGYSIGVAITGSEDVGLSLIITEGFGKMNMSVKTFDLLKSNEGVEATMNGATQVRAGVIRPEIIIPQKELSPAKSSKEVEEVFNKGMTPGMRVRVIREPAFGALGEIIRLPVEPQQLESESEARVLEVKLDDGRRLILPRTNVEIIEE